MLERWFGSIWQSKDTDVSEHLARAHLGAEAMSRADDGHHSERQWMERRYISGRLGEYGRARRRPVEARNLRMQRDSFGEEGRMEKRAFRLRARKGRERLT